MSTYIDLDSFQRDFDQYPNSASYIVTDENVATWSRAPRTTMANSINPGARAIEFSQSVEAKHVILPYTAITYVDSTGVTQNTHTADLQRIYLNVHTSQYDDKQLMYSINNKVSRARFVLVRDMIQTDSSGDPAWVVFKSKMDQVMRFQRNAALTVEIMQEEGFTIIITDGALPGSVTKSLQTYVLLEVTPYFIDGRYDNHSLGLTQF